MTKAIEDLSGDDATAFRAAIRPHVEAVLGAAGHAVFVGPTQPVFDGPYVWVDTSGGGVTIWLEDGV